MYLRIWFCVLFLSMSLGVALAQVKFGIKIGSGLSFLTGGENKHISNQSGIGFNIGAFTKVKLSSFGLQVDLLYSLLPTRQTVEPKASEEFLGDLTTQFTYNFSYFTLPVGLRYYFPAGPYLQLGPQFNFLLSKPIKAKAMVGDLSIESALDSDDFPVSDFNWGVFGGGGWAFPFGLSIDLRYYTAISELFDLENENNNEAKELLDERRLQVISLGIGYTL